MPLVVLFSVILLAGTVNQAAYSSTSHPFISQWGQSGTGGSGAFLNPQGVDTDSSGNVYVSDLGNHRVQKFDNDGTFLFAWGSSGTGSGQFHSVAGIAVNDDHVYVVDSQLNQVQKFDTNGNFISKWGSKGTQPGEFLVPAGIGIGKNGTVFVADTGNQRVQKFTAQGEFILEFGQSGNHDGEFTAPNDVAVDDFGNIYVSDPGSSKITKFNPSGGFVKKFGPNAGGLTISPHGLLVDPLGNIYAADTNRDRVIQFDSEGTTLATFGIMGIFPGQFKMPKDVALDKYGDLFVVDTNGHRIQKFETPLEIDLIDTSAAEESNPETTEPYEYPITVTTPSVADTQNNQIITQSLPPPNPIPGDLTKPTITPPNDLLIEATGGLTPVSVGQALANDESGISSLTNNAPAQFPLGVTTIIWTAIDGSGNMAIATQTITVVDSIAPIISAAESVTIEAEDALYNTAELPVPVASDAVGVISLTNNAPESFPLGESTVTWTATDVAGNTASITQQVTVIDTTAPTLQIPQDIIIEAVSSDQNQVDIGEATVLDNGEISSITNDAPQFFAIGNTTVTWIAADASGNTETQQQLISVVDTVPPQITAPENITFEAISTDSNVIEIGLPIVSDVQDVTITNDAPAVFGMGETTVTWNAVDLFGNNSTANQIISVVDTTAPIVTAPADITIEAVGVENYIDGLGEVTIEDISGISSIIHDAPESFPFGSTIVTWSITDSYGNIATIPQTINVVDTTAPTLSVPSDITIEATDALANFVDLGQPTVNDIIEVSSVINDAPESFPIGVTSVTWTAIDSSGNSISDIQTVTVEDTTAPEIIPPTDVISEAVGPDGVIVDIGQATATDIIDVSTITHDAPSIFPIGNTVVSWLAADSHGNTITANQTISVVDTTAPSITAPVDVIIEAQNPTSNVVEIGVAQSDDLVGVLTLDNDAPDAFALGDSIVTWTATDAAGNIATATQLVSVVDSTSPTITAPSPIQVEATSDIGSVADIGIADAFDAIGIESVTHDAPEVFPIGQTVVTWTATDLSGHSVSATQTVDVVDTTAPVIDVDELILVEAANLDANIVEFGVIDVSDAVGVTSVTNDAPDAFSLGLTSVTWTAIDAAGNTAIASQMVSIVDTTIPTITPPTDVVMEASSFDNNQVVLGNAQASDLVEISSVSNDAPAAFTLGETNVIWTATDSSGNSVNATQLVTITDVTAPTIAVPENITVEATSANDNVIALSSPLAEDAVSTVDVTNDAPSVYPVGDTTVTWTATDVAGNIANVIQTVSVIDTSAPTIAVPENITIEATSVAGNQIALGNSTADDAVGISSIVNDAPEVFEYGQTVVTWTATDTSGNTVSATQTVDVIDTTSPTLFVPENITIEATGIEGNLVDIGVATASDIIEVSSLTNDAPDSFALGDSIVTWTAIDQAGNTISASQTISVVDTTAPTLIIPDNVVVDATSMETMVSIGQATSSDLIDLSPVISNNAPSIYPLGETTVTWSTIDEFGNSIEATQIVEVQACGKEISYYNMITGTLEDDILAGTTVADLIFALGGDDVVIGDKGNDCIFGGEGDDIIFGNEGNDTLAGDEGTDVLKGQSGEDSITGGTGVDVIDGGDDSDSCNVVADTDGDLIVKCEL